MSKEISYFDHNGTTLICKRAEETYNKWLSCYNLSSSSKVVAGAKCCVEETTNYILDHCGISQYTHTVIYNSGATEGNCFILRSVAKAYRRELLKTNPHSKELPHIICSEY